MIYQIREFEDLTMILKFDSMKIWIVSRIDKILSHLSPPIFWRHYPSEVAPLFQERRWPISRNGKNIDRRKNGK